MRGTFGLTVAPSQGHREDGFCPSLSPSIMDSGEQNSTGNGPTVFNLHLGSRMMEVRGGAVTLFSCSWWEIKLPRVCTPVNSDLFSLQKATDI